MNGRCAICSRQARGFQHTNPDTGEVLQACSMRHLSLALEKLQWTEAEKQAVLAGGDCGGYYLDEIGIADLTKLSAGEWGQFITHVINGYTLCLDEAAKGIVPNDHE